jgi:hypothetical protein
VFPSAGGLLSVADFARPLTVSNHRTAARGSQLKNGKSADISVA